MSQKTLPCTLQTEKTITESMNIRAPGMAAREKDSPDKTSSRRTRLAVVEERTVMHLGS